MGQIKYNSTPITTAATTVVKTGTGVFGGIQVQGGTTGTITVYDNTSAAGKVIANFDTTLAIAPTYMFETGVSIGITVVTSAATKITVLWK
jgi:hypothetical protein